MEQVQDIDAVVVPTGGGGLLAGVAVAVKTLNPSIKIIVCHLGSHIFFINILENILIIVRIPFLISLEYTKIFIYNYSLLIQRKSYIHL